MVVIPNPVTRFPKVSANWTNKTVISVGRHEPMKGFDMLIDAWAIVAKKHPDWTLKICGPGNNEPYKKQAEKLGLHQIKDLGFVESVYDEMSTASIYVLSSRFEGFGIVLIEAMAMGLPCVAFTCPAGPRDIVSNHQDGILVEKNNVPKLAEAICFLIDESDEDAMEFVRRVIGMQDDQEPLHIVEQLVEIAVGELKGRPCQMEAAVSDKRIKVTLRHDGKPIDERMVWLMGDHTDRVDYSPDGDTGYWLLTIRRDIPPLFVTRR